MFEKARFVTGFIRKEYLPKNLWNKDHKTKKTYFRMVKNPDSPVVRVTAIELMGFPSGWDEVSQDIFMFMHRNHMTQKAVESYFDLDDLRASEEKLSTPEGQESLRVSAERMDWGGLDLESRVDTSTA